MTAPLLLQGTLEGARRRHAGRRVALFYDHRIYTTGLYCLRALQSLCRAEVFLPRRRWLAPRGFDLYLAVDDSSHYLFPPWSAPSAYWVSDTHRAYRPDLAMCRSFGRVFAIHAPGAGRLGADGIPARWLPPAADPEIHGGGPLPKTYDIAFVGQPGEGERARLLEILKARHPRSFIGYAPYEEVSRIYRQAKVVFNHSISGDVNMRVFEALAAGTLLVTDDPPGAGLGLLFKPGEQLVTYGGEKDLLGTIDYFLAREREREEIAARGRAEIQARHTYAHRMAALLDVVFEGPAPRGPWAGFARGAAGLLAHKLLRLAGR